MSNTYPTNDSLPHRADARDTTTLSTHYGRIGIQAVAAAARFSTPLAGERDAPRAPRIDQRFVESAA